MANWKGENNPQYNPDYTKEERETRRDCDGTEKSIRKQIRREQDHCCICGKSHGKMEAHHLYSWVRYPEHRQDKQCVVLLCEACHKAYHKNYGRGRISNTPEEFKQFTLERRRELNNEQNPFTADAREAKLAAKRKQKKK